MGLFKMGVAGVVSDQAASSGDLQPASAYCGAGVDGFRHLCREADGEVPNTGAGEVVAGVSVGVCRHHAPSRFSKLAVETVKKIGHFDFAIVAEARVIGLEGDSLRGGVVGWVSLKLDRGGGGEKMLSRAGWKRAVKRYGFERGELRNSVK
ncbi:hypothetical protein Vretifemale_12874 [Volvox reticuliferus]|uniref:Uncharacterized protein n=1 Tax=Volvox reticuliferus TaxID=1737510 RepID=A0A8J4FRJ5_9CHLO|nr:hypothetical protein Vretifemale_12874 [Volvox reticuliferus]